MTATLHPHGPPIAIGLVVSMTLFLPGPTGCGSGTRQIGINNLKMASLAMQSISDRDRGFPAAIVAADGRPLLSWRVAILPFLGDDEAALYREFRLGEPWDSDHNKPLIARMPAVFATPGSDAAAGLTGMILPAEPEWAFGTVSENVPLADADGALLAIVKASEFRDGLSNTPMILSVPGLREPWTKPDNTTTGVVGLFESARKAGHREILVATGDAAVRGLSTNTKPETLVPLFTRAGGDSFVWPD